MTDRPTDRPRYSVCNSRPRLRSQYCDAAQDVGGGRKGERVSAIACRERSGADGGPLKRDCGVEAGRCDGRVLSVVVASRRM